MFREKLRPRTARFNPDQASLHREPFHGCLHDAAPVSLPVGQWPRGFG
ncbi:hypothetical protein A176_003297 [Myxococcus hansupus]|uniref:Uncharacterized protein n=1 Tax=Pseudomyxococcus hansupus TaxID=1297742 RepID=A0A0H4WYF2_9BACT|nr:hypothetical protein A176_003297 [Myxococcus hansupus]